MKLTNILLVIVSILAISLTSCKPKEKVVDAVEEAEQAVEEVIEEVTASPVDTDDCKYKLIEGKGTIKRMNFSNPDNVVIQFDFEPSKGSGIEPSSLNIFSVNGVGKYPPRDWCEKNGVEQGATFKVNMYQLTDNSDTEYCEKKVFSFVDFEDKGWK